MKYYQPSYYNSFKCIASDCTDTCCRFWQVELDKSTVEKYSAIDFDNEISKELKTAIAGSKRNRIFKNKAGGDCPFLNNSLLCELHTAVGHHNLPRTCRLFPRFINTFGGYEERGLSFSCPAAAKLIFESSVDFCQFEDELPITDYTDINAELFFAVRSARDKLLEFISTTACDAEQLLFAVLAFSRLVQEKITSQHYNEIENLSLDVTYGRCKVLTDERLRLKTINDHKRHKHLRKTWKEELNRASENAVKTDTEALKIWLTYFIYRYLINSAQDKLFLPKVKAAILSFLVIGSLNFELPEAMQKYSKETEHNKYNIERLFKFAKRTKL